MKRKRLWSFRGVGLDLLHLCFDHRSESDQGVVFDKNVIFSTILFKMLPFFKLTDIQVLIKKIHEANKMFFNLKYS